MSWMYYVLGALVVVVGVVLYLFYKGYNKVKPKPLPGKLATVISPFGWHHLFAMSHLHY